MFALPTTAHATYLLPANWRTADLRGLSEGRISGLFLSDSSALRPEGHT